MSDITQGITQDDLLAMLKAGAIKITDINGAMKELKGEISRKINGVRDELANSVVQVLESAPEFVTDCETVGEYIRVEYHSDSLTLTCEDTHGKYRVVIHPLK